MIYLDGEIGEVYLNGRYHEEAYLGDVLVWSRLKKWEGSAYGKIAFANGADGEMLVFFLVSERASVDVVAEAAAQMREMAEADGENQIALRSIAKEMSTIVLSPEVLEKIILRSDGTSDSVSVASANDLFGILLHSQAREDQAAVSGGEAEAEIELLAEAPAVIISLEMDSEAEMLTETTQVTVVRFAAESANEREHLAAETRMPAIRLLTLPAGEAESVSVTTEMPTVKLAAHPVEEAESLVAATQMPAVKFTAKPADETERIVLATEQPTGIGSALVPFGNLSRISAFSETGEAGVVVPEEGNSDRSEAVSAAAQAAREACIPGAGYAEEMTGSRVEPSVMRIMMAYIRDFERANTSVVPSVLASAAAAEGLMVSSVAKGDYYPHAAPSVEHERFVKFVEGSLDEITEADWDGATAINAGWTFDLAPNFTDTTLLDSLKRVNIPSSVATVLRSNTGNINNGNGLGIFNFYLSSTIEYVKVSPNLSIGAMWSFYKVDGAKYVVDFSDNTSVPSLWSVGTDKKPFNGATIRVPAALLTTWKNAWSSYINSSVIWEGV